jgi:hypothetical protein
MAIDIRQAFQTVMEAALREPTPPPKAKQPWLTSGRAVLVGAGLVTAGRLAASGRGRGIVGSLRQRLGNARLDDELDQHLDEDAGDDYDDEDYDDDEPEADDEFDENEPEDRPKRRSAPRSRD